MAQQEGPFSEYLQQLKMTPQVQVPQPTGMENTGTAIGNIAMNFINGLRQGRQQKYMQQQMEEQRKFDAYQQAMQRVASSDLTDNEKRGLYAELETPLIRRIAGDPEATSKKTGNPLTDVIKNLASSVTGPVPKKGMELTMDPVLKALQAVSDPNRSRTRLASQYEGRIRSRLGQIIKDNPYMQSGDILKDPEISAVRQEAEQSLGGAFASPALSEALQEFRSPSPSEQLKMRVMQQFLGPVGAQAPSGAASARTGVPPVAAAPVATGAQPPVPAKGAPSPARVGIPLSQEEINQAATAAQVTGLSLYREGQATEEFETPSGERLTGKNITGNFQGRGVMSGIYDPDTQTLYPLSSLKRLKPGQPTQAELALTGKEVSGQAASMISSLPKPVASAFQAEIEAAMRTGDLNALRRIPLRITEALSDQEKQKAIDARQSKAFSQQDAVSRERFDRQDRQSQQRAAATSSNAFLRDPAKRSFDQVDILMEGLVNEPKLLSYLKDPKGSKLTQSELTLIDKSLARVASKATDPTTGVKQAEEEGYNSLVGVVAKLGINLKSVTDGGSILGNYETRKALYDMLANIYNAQKRKSDQVKGQYMQSASWVEPEILNRAFGVGVEPAQPSTTVAPPRKPTYTPASGPPVTTPGSLSQIPGAQRRSQ